MEVNPSFDLKLGFCSFTGELMRASVCNLSQPTSLALEPHLLHQPLCLVGLVLLRRAGAGAGGWPAGGDLRDTPPLVEKPPHQRGEVHLAPDLIQRVAHPEDLIHLGPLVAARPGHGEQRLLQPDRRAEAGHDHVQYRQHAAPGRRGVAVAPGDGGGGAAVGAGQVERPRRDADAGAAEAVARPPLLLRGRVPPVRANQAVAAAARAVVEGDEAVGAAGVDGEHRGARVGGADLDHAAVVALLAAPDDAERGGVRVVDDGQRHAVQHLPRLVPLDQRHVVRRRVHALLRVIHCPTIRRRKEIGSLICATRRVPEPRADRIAVRRRDGLRFRGGEGHTSSFAVRLLCRAIRWVRDWPCDGMRCRRSPPARRGGGGGWQVGPGWAVFLSWALLVQTSRAAIRRSF